MPTTPTTPAMQAEPGGIALPPPEPGKKPALILAAAVHLLLVVALVFGVQWKQQNPESVAVEVWRSVPVANPTPPAEVTPPPPAPEPKAEPKSEPKPEPKPVVKEPPPPTKPDIALKDDKKKPEKKPEEKKPEPKPEPKPEKKAEKPPSFDDALKREMAQLDRQKAVQGERARAEQEARQLALLKADQAVAGRAKAEQTYAGKIRDKIRGNVVLPPALTGNPVVLFQVEQLPTGEVLTVKMTRSSGIAAYDSAVERAIWKSSPLPLPDDRGLFERELKLTFCPKETSAGCGK